MYVCIHIYIYIYIYTDIHIAGVLRLGRGDVLRGARHEDAGVGARHEDAGVL